MNNFFINKKSKILIFISFFFVLISLFLFLLCVLGRVSRVGYLSDLKLNQEYQSEFNIANDEINKFLIYNFKFETDSKIFKNSDLYDIYIDFDSSTNENIKYIKTTSKGSPFGVLLSTEELSSDHYNYSYSLKIRKRIIVFYLLALIIFIIYIIVVNSQNIIVFMQNCFNNSKYEKYNKIIFFIFLFIFIIYTVNIFIISNVISKKEYTTTVDNLNLLYQSELGYVYNAKIDIKNKYLFSFKNNSFLTTNNIKSGYSIKITNKPISSWHSTNIYYTTNNSFIIDNEASDINAYTYNIKIPTYYMDKYNITIIAKKIPNTGIFEWHLNSANNFKPITNMFYSNDYVVLTDTRNIYRVASGNLDFNLIFPKGITEIESIYIDNISTNFIYKNDIVFTSKDRIDNITFSYKVVLNKIYYYVIPFGIILLILLFNTKKLFLREITNIDWILFSFLSLFCFFSFQQGDISHTVSSSFTYLNGYIFNFYSHNLTLPYIVGNNYMPSTYILFAIWNIPMKLFFGMDGSNSNLYLIWYNKILTTIFYIFSSIVIFYICKALKFDNKKSKIAMFMWISTPIAMFSQFIFGQYDIFTLFFTLLGIYYYLKDNNFKFILFFGIALTFKYFPLFVFIVLLLHKEKNIFKIIKSCIFVTIPFIIELLIYINDSGFKTGVLGFGATSYVFNLNIPSSYFIDIKVLLFAWILLCAFIYLNNKDLFEQKVFYYLSLLSFILFGLSLWHPQWVLFITPFLVLSTIINRRYDFFILLDIALMFSFIWFTVNTWTNHVDSYLLGRGIFSNIANPNYHPLISSILKDSNKISYTFFSAILLINALYKHPKFAMNNIQDDISDAIPLIRLRLLVGIMIFIIPAFFITLL